MKLFLKLIESYVFVLAISLGIGLLFPTFGLYFAPAGTIFLQIIFFLSSLKLDLRVLGQEIKQVRAVFLVNLYTLVVFPIVVFLLAKIFLPQYAIPLLILAALPAGMTSPLITEIVGGSVGLSLVITVTSSLLSPVTIPLVIKLLLGTTVEVPVLNMFTTLLLVIVIPFVLAQIVRKIAHERIKKSYFTFKPISIALLGLLIIGIVAGQATAIAANISHFIPALIVLAVFLALLHIVGYWGVPGLNKKQRLATTVCLAYMNFTLGIYLVGKFFPQPEVVVPVVLMVFPWSIGLVVFQYFARRALAR